MKRTLLVFVLCACAVDLTARKQPAGGASGQPSGMTRPERVENGRKLYVRYGCYQCHGYVAQGGSGPRLGPDPIPLEAFIRILRRPPNVMPPYTEKVVTDQELTDIRDFVTSVPRPPRADDIPLLKALQR
jgi:mono/diheme cytochrome c family protein